MDPRNDLFEFVYGKTGSIRNGFDGGLDYQVLLACIDWLECTFEEKLDILEKVTLIEPLIQAKQAEAAKQKTKDPVSGPVNTQIRRK